MPEQIVIDVTNLKKEVDEIKLKSKELKNSRVLLIGIIIGAIISALIQLLILPLSYESTIIKYNGNPLIENVSTGEYIFWILVIIGIFILLVIKVVYKRFLIGIKPEIKTQITYEGDYEIVYRELKNFLRNECENLSIRLRAPRNKIGCFRGKWEDEDRPLILTFKSGSRIIDIKFMPEDEDSKELIGKIIENYERRSEVQDF